MNFESYGDSDVGLVRLNNEDVWAQLPKEQCFIVADGMGGHQAGEIAASETVVQLCKKIKEARKEKRSVDEWVSFLDEAIRSTNSWIYELASKDQNMEGMGTTLCLALIINHTLLTAHVGDSRIYRIRKGRLTQLTQDHSLKDELIAKGELDESLALSFPYKNVITRAIGTQNTVTPEIHSWDVEKKDLYLLCTDGLTDTLLDSQILDIVESSPSIQQATQELILEAKKTGGNDNITIVMLKIK